MPSSPVGYADDLASGCIDEHRLNQVMRIVYRHGCTWRYEYNARKSGVLIFGGDRTGGRINTPLKEFSLGEAKVLERLHYDHVGIRTSVNVSDITGIEERISKARKSLNAATGLGIRKNGLTISTCNIIFWSLVVPTALYGSEIWRLDTRAISLLEGFQNYAAKKIQRFYGKVPNACSLYALGWMRLERYVQVKKMLFIRSIMVLDNQVLSKQIFCERAAILLEQGVEENFHGYSVVSDLLRTADLFNLLNDVQNMVLRGHQFSKQIWKERVWARAWELEDVYWQIQFRVSRNLDIISRVSANCNYLTWWYLSDRFPTSIIICETLARLVCHASLLKVDDVRLKQLNRSDRVCSLCDLYEEDDVRHLIMQCPTLQPERTVMFTELRHVGEGHGERVMDRSGDILSVLLGKPAEDLAPDQMDEFWLVAGKHINIMYQRNIKLRKGIG